MTGSAERSAHKVATSTTAPILVLGLGNLLLGDDGVGLCLLQALEREFDATEAIEFVDGGTQGLALMGYLAERSAVLVLDAISLGRPAGSVHVLRGAEMQQLRARRANSAHEGNALELFDNARMLGYEWSDLSAIGIEPLNIRTGIGLSQEVESGVNEALQQARKILGEMVNQYVSGDSR